MSELKAVSQLIGTLGAQMRRTRNPETKRAKKIDAAYVEATNRQAELSSEIAMGLRLGFDDE